MKNYHKIIIIGIISLLCSGCVKFDGTVSINSFKNMNIHIDYGVINELDEYHVFTDDQINDMKDFGYKIKDYNDDKYHGVSIDYKINNIDKVSSSDEVIFSITSLKDKKPEEIFQVKRGFFSNTYVAKFKFDTTDLNINSDINSSDTMQFLCEDGSVINVGENDTLERGDCHSASSIEIENALSSNPLSSEELSKKYNAMNDLHFRVKVNHLIDSDASKVKGNELIWNLKNNGINDINFSFKETNYGSYIIVILAVVLLVILFTFIFRNKKKQK